MSADELKRIRAQQEAQAAAIQRMQMQNQAQQARRHAEEEEFEPPRYQHEHQIQQPQNYEQVDPNQAMLQHIIHEAGQRAAYEAQRNLQATQDVSEKVKQRMERLVKDFPAMQEEDSLLTIKARESYARIAAENPSLDEPTRYELAVREAASLIGARPMTASIEDTLQADYLMPSNGTRNHAAGRTRTKSRLTPAIVENARLMGINVDPSTPEGKKNLAELSENSARFNADVDESQYKYR